MIEQVIKEQRAFFNTHETLQLSFRINSLKKLKRLIIEYQEDILNALKIDLNKSRVESYMSEIGMVLSELDHTLKNIKKWSKTQRVKTPIAQFKAKSYIIKEPFGVVLIMSPWNYPFLLTFGPLISAMATGNTCIIKPSEYSAETTKVMELIVNQHFSKSYIYLIKGDIEMNKKVLAMRYDFIFFTGSTKVAKIVMNHASQYLTPVVLELGGKSPGIVDDTANLPQAARRIVFGKFLNAGQTCVAPDYLYIDEKIKSEFIKLLINEIKIQFKGDALKANYYCKIISKSHQDRLSLLLDKNKIVYGGEILNQKIAPTIMDNVSFNDLVMQEEIFGPILPIITFSKKSEVLENLKEEESPLALYVFSKDSKFIKETQKLRFGGGCINDTIIHLASNNLPFGGIGNSGIGSYHGKYGFDTFTHQKSIVDKSTLIDLPMRYYPYNDKKERLIRRFLK